MSDVLHGFIDLKVISGTTDAIARLAPFGPSWVKDALQAFVNTGEVTRMQEAFYTFDPDVLFSALSPATAFTVCNEWLRASADLEPEYVRIAQAVFFDTTGDARERQRCQGNWLPLLAWDPFVFLVKDLLVQRGNRTPEAAEVEVGLWVATLDRCRRNGESPSDCAEMVMAALTRTAQVGLR